MFNKTTVNKISRINKNSFTLYHHLGLGDFIICNGLVNYLSKDFEKIYIPVVSPYKDMISYLYKENKKVLLFEIPNENRDENIEQFSKELNLQILKVGFEKVKKKEFNLAFYKQLNIPYEVSFNHFALPSNKEQEILMDHLIDYFKGDINDICLVHSESHNEKYNLKISKDKKVIYINKESDLFKNIFFYEKIIKEAKEIHCINSVFVHLVERVETDAKLFFHNVRYSKMHLLKDWEVINY